MNDLMEFEASLETSSTIDLEDTARFSFDALEAEEDPREPLKTPLLMRESSATSTFSAKSETIGGDANNVGVS